MDIFLYIRLDTYRVAQLLVLHNNPRHNRKENLSTREQIFIHVGFGEQVMYQRFP